MRIILFFAIAALLPAAPSPAQKENTAKPPTAAKQAEVEKVRLAMMDAPRVEPKQPRKLLIFWRCEGFAHSCVPLASRTFEIMGEKTGAYAPTLSDDMDMFLPENLAEFDAVLFNNTTHLQFENPKHREGLMRFVKSGKGVIGIHAASDNFYTWPEAAEMMGGLFDNHPWHAGGTWAIKVEDPGHPISRAFDGQDFLINDEIYQIKGPYSRDTHRVLLRLDMTKECNHKVKKEGIHREDMDFAVAWIRTFGKGRVFYSSLGHNHHIYWNEQVLQHYLDGIQWALGDQEVDPTPSNGFDVDWLTDDGLTAFRGDTGDWMSVGEAFKHPEDEKKLASNPGAGTLVNGKDGRTKHLVSQKEYGDIEAHIEFMVPKGSNSGVYFMGRYEIQVLDSFGVKEPKHSDCGGIYQRWNPKAADGNHGYDGRPPRTNASREPGRWQSFDVLFKAPRFDEAGHKIANARFVRVIHNGIVVHRNEELTGPTRAALYQDEKPTGPLMLQGDHGPVAYRNIRIAVRKNPKKEERFKEREASSIK
jgi:type 1 glutamine amidotransferase